MTGPWQRIIDNSICANSRKSSFPSNIAHSAHIFSRYKGNEFVLYGKGFGKPSKESISTEEKSASADSDASKSCPCGSGENYASCCQPYHTYNSVADTLEKVTRARYSAFAFGISDYLMDTTNPSHKDYKRHMDANLDVKQAKKAWKNELVKKNTEVFQFLGLDIVPNSASQVSFLFILYPHIYNFLHFDASDQFRVF
jgi:uncharacterized protein YchJ